MHYPERVSKVTMFFSKNKKEMRKEIGELLYQIGMEHDEYKEPDQFDSNHNKKSQLIRSVGIFLKGDMVLEDVYKKYLDIIV